MSPVEHPVARMARAQRGRGTPDRRAQRRISATGRGYQLGLDRVPGVVLADVTDRETHRAMGIGEVLVDVWCTDLDDLDDLRFLVDQLRPPEMTLVVVPHQAKRRHRWIARWRYLRDRLLRRWP